MACAILPLNGIRVIDQYKEGCIAHFFFFVSIAHQIHLSFKCNHRLLGKATVHSPSIEYFLIFKPTSSSVSRRTASRVFHPLLQNLQLSRTLGGMLVHFEPVKFIFTRVITVMTHGLTQEDIVDIGMGKPDGIFSGMNFSFYGAAMARPCITTPF